MGEDAVLRQFQLDDYYGLNKVGAMLWVLTDGKKCIRELAGDITREFEISQAEAERDIVELADQLANEGLVKVVETPEDDKTATESA